MVDRAARVPAHTVNLRLSPRGRPAWTARRQRLQFPLLRQLVVSVVMPILKGPQVHVERPIRRPELTELETFVIAARGGSLASAARRLRISTPAVAKRIDSLEATVGLRLLERGRSGVRLTDEGRRLRAPRRAAARPQRRPARRSRRQARRRRADPRRAGSPRQPRTLHRGSAVRDGGPACADLPPQLQRDLRGPAGRPPPL